MVAGVRRQFFFEKKNQKTFGVMAYAAGENPDSDVKVFCFFSSEKKKSSSATEEHGSAASPLFTHPTGGCKVAGCGTAPRRGSGERRCI
jgi:hypothetical protein